MNKIVKLFVVVIPFILISCIGNFHANIKLCEHENDMMPEVEVSEPGTPFYKVLILNQDVLELEVKFKEECMSGITTDFEREGDKINFEWIRTITQEELTRAHEGCYCQYEIVFRLNEPKIDDISKIMINGVPLSELKAFE
jgi:hypothetical protein